MAATTIAVISGVAELRGTTLGVMGNRIILVVSGKMELAGGTPPVVSRSASAFIGVISGRMHLVGSRLVVNPGTQRRELPQTIGDKQLVNLIGDERIELVSSGSIRQVVTLRQIADFIKGV